MKYLSVCSGIEAATQSWSPLGWEPVAFSEIEKFPSAVLAHHYPNVPNWGDMTNFKEWPDAAVDVLVGGTPCQSFSVAGLRKGLDDPRGNLALTYLAIAERYRPDWLVWENVPGVLSSDGGRSFGAIIGGMVELGYCPSWRVLDAQYVRTRRFPRAIPQRRRRVFVVAHLGDWRRAAAVLFDSESLRGDPPPSREAGEAAPTIPSRSTAGGGLGTDFDCDGGAITAHETGQGWWKQADHAGALRAEGENRPSRPSHVVAHALRGEGIDASEDGTGRGTPIVPEVAGTFKSCSESGGWSNSADHAAAGYMVPVLSSGQANAELCDNLSPALNCNRDGSPIVGQPISFGAQMSVPQIDVGVNQTLQAKNPMAVALQTANTGANGRNWSLEVTHTLDQASPPAVAQSMAVRRLTPVECERLMGFPEGFTAIPWRGKEPESCPDGPRYKALGNSMAVNVMCWIGDRIAAVNEIGGGS